jgi:tetratricopeptide (TPR) repeat protein
MSAVVAVLNESLTESLRGFYRLRKAFATLQEIIEAENRYVEQNFSKSTSSLASTDARRSAAAHETPSAVTTPEDEDEMDFKDASEDVKDQPTPVTYQGHVEFPDLQKLGLHERTNTTPGLEANSAGAQEPPAPSNIRVDSKAFSKADDRTLDFTTVTDDPIDLFIHSGTAMCFGLLQLLLSMIPPAFGKILSIFSFRGDRENGLRLLWEATRFKTNINGAMAGLVLLPFHNAAIALCDIHRREAYPKERLQVLLQDMRQLYPESIMWAIQEAGMYATEKDVEKAVDTMQRAPQASSLKQMEALRIFELSMSSMFLHRYEDAAGLFMQCVDVNNWSHGLYYYIAGACHLELYRRHRASDPTVAAAHKSQARTMLLHVPANVGKKRFMARQLPLDVFISRKITKWQHRAKTRDCDLVDAVGVSPVEEMCYLWSGYRRMRPSHLHTSLEALAWSEHQASWPDEPADEKAIQALLKATCLRTLGRIDEAKTMLSEHVLCHDISHIVACDHPDNWPLPVAHYELCVCYWDEAGGQDGDRAKLKLCSDELAKVERWGSFELDARIGMKLTTARQTLTVSGIS